MEIVQVIASYIMAGSIITYILLLIWPEMFLSISFGKNRRAKGTKYSFSFPLTRPYVFKEGKGLGDFRKQSYLQRTFHDDKTLNRQTYFVFAVRQGPSQKTIKWHNDQFVAVGRRDEDGLVEVFNQNHEWSSDRCEPHWFNGVELLY